MKLLVSFWTASAILAQQYTISTVAGGGVIPTPAVAANTALPDTSSIAVDSAGNEFAISWNLVYRIDPNGILTLVAGTPREAGLGDGGPATNAQMSTWLEGLAADASGNLYIADTGNSRVRKVSPDGIITTYAGTGTAGVSGDGGPAASARLQGPEGLAVDLSGNLFILDGTRIRKVSASGIITTYAGTGTCGYSGDGGPAIKASDLPECSRRRSAGNLYFSDYTSRVRKISPDGTISTIAGNGSDGYSGDGGPALSATFHDLWGIAVDGAGNIFVADALNTCVRRIGTDGIITTFAAADPASYPLGWPDSIAADANGNVYAAGADVFKITPDGGMTRFAGNGTSGYYGDGGPAADAVIVPFGVAVDTSGNPFIIADQDAYRISQVSPDGTINTVVEDNVPGLYGYSAGIAADSDGNLYLAETVANVVRKITPDGAIATIAGNGTFGHSGDGGPATEAELNYPAAVTVDTSRNLYITDFLNNSVRMVNTDGVISTFAGTGVAGDFRRRGTRYSCHTQQSAGHSRR